MIIKAIMHVIYSFWEKIANTAKLEYCEECRRTRACLIAIVSSVVLLFSAEVVLFSTLMLLFLIEMVLFCE